MDNHKIFIDMLIEQLGNIELSFEDHLFKLINDYQKFLEFQNYMFDQAYLEDIRTCCINNRDKIEVLSILFNEYLRRDIEELFDKYNFDSISKKQFIMTYMPTEGIFDERTTRLSKRIQLAINHRFGFV